MPLPSGCSLLEIEASGEPRAIGRAIGEAARGLMVAAAEYYREHWQIQTGYSFADAERIATASFLPAARELLPAGVAEIEGMAEGSGVAFLTLFALNCGEEFGCTEDPGAAVAQTGHRALSGHCTSLGISIDGVCLLGHNEDWFACDTERKALLRITTADGTRIVAVTPPPLVAFTGISEHGIAGAANTVYSNDNFVPGTAELRPGLPNNLLRRRLLESRTLEEARDWACHPRRVRGSNHIMGDASGRLWDIETSATAAASIDADVWLAHTNHYVTPEMAPFELSTSRNSRARLARARELTAAGVAAGDDPRALIPGVLADHENGENSICSHPWADDPPPLQEMTTASMVWDLGEMTVDVCAGTPCANERRRFGFDW